jgi:hypothetical protein
VTDILNKEGIKYDIKDVADIISAFYPDIRRVLNTIQLQCSNGTLKVDTQTALQNDFKIKILDILKNGSEKRNMWMEIRQIIANNKITEFSELYTYLYEKVDEYGKENKSGVILALSDSQQRDALVVDKEIPFIAGVIQIVSLIR